MDFAEYLKNSAKALDKEVGKILEEQLKEAEKTDKKLVPLLKAFSKTCQGGKRIRGALIMLGYEIAAHLPGVRAHLGGEIIKVAAAYEIAHSAVLIHDDIIDKSLTRRDKPSLYMGLGGNHYGISQAICLADYGFFLAFKIIAKTKAAEVFSQVMMNTTWGQMLDIEKADPKVVMRLKTACYTIAGPLQIGAILAGADEKSVRVLGEFGENLGIAYQIKDDILDEEVNSLESAEKYINQAMKMLPEITKDQEMSKLLQQMADYLVQRTK